MATLGAVGCSLFYKDGASVATSIGIGYLVGAVGVVSSFLVRNLPGNFGSTRPGLAVELVIHLVGAYVMLTGQSYATTLIKGIATFGLLNALFGILKPSNFAEIWGLKESDAKDETVSFLARTVSFAIAAPCVTILALLFDVTPSQAVGYGSLTLLLMLVIETLITSEVASLKLQKEPIYYWMAFLGGLCAVVALPGVSGA